MIFVISSGFLTDCAVQLQKYKNDDDNIHTAWQDAMIGSIINWTIIGVSILLIILAVVGVVGLFGSGAGEAGVEGEEAEETKMKKSGKTGKKSKIKEGFSGFTIFVFIVTILLVGLTGGLAANAAVKIQHSSLLAGNDRIHKAYTDAIIAAVSCLVSVSLLVIGFIVYIVVTDKRKAKIEEAKKEAESKTENSKTANNKASNSKTLNNNISALAKTFMSTN